MSNLVAVCLRKVLEPFFILVLVEQRISRISESSVLQWQSTVIYIGDCS